ncbi:hypothetical protein [Massilia sp. Se16.2.3]|uniref:hypothetical protein n=1 Tax=Massilia sp. Se16.2.3 TaxID=2709303 RepID=UPI001602187F|nr:hypothetical protein [Massilia sp. Se16.2.3]QNB00105.1 hypothetical protein G4G31_16920 [Massilia sp. Se16.2.3]
MMRSRDPLGNETVVEAVDYRVLQARRIRDPNGNRSEVAFDILGQVVGTAVMGKAAPAPVEGDTLDGFVTDPPRDALDALFGSEQPHAAAALLLAGASTRIVHDLDRFQRTRAAHPHDPAQWQPPCSAALAREVHVAGPELKGEPPIQLSFSYFDGFGREIQKKREAESGAGFGARTQEQPGRRWVASGWIVFNNKGKPVRQFEPFFSAGPRYEPGTRAGVSPVLFYDPLGRVVATLQPNDSYEKIVYRAWEQVSFDANDSCLLDPRRDPDIATQVAPYFATLPGSWESWYAQRSDGRQGERERLAAARAAAHAGTPTATCLDPLGRTFLTLTRNRVVCPGHPADGRTETFHPDRTRPPRPPAGLRDPSGQALAVPGRTAMRFAYDLMGNRVRSTGIDAGTRWILPDCGGLPMRAWDSRGHVVTTGYDALRRPLLQSVRGEGPGADPRTRGRELVVDRIEYGEGLADAGKLNLRTRIYRHMDTAGVATNAGLDAEGPALAGLRLQGQPAAQDAAPAGRLQGYPGLACGAGAGG